MILNDIATIYDCPHSTAPDEGIGYPLIRTPNIGKGRLILDNVHRVSETVYETRNKRATPKEGDIIFAREAPAGNAAVITDGQKVCLGQRTVLIRPKQDLVDSHFLVYYLLAPQQQVRLLGYSHGSTVSHVNIPDIAKLPIELPCLSQQRRIAAIIEHYDNLIEVNNQRIKKLEQTAEELYKEWFVRFRFPNYQNTEFENGIPKGWETFSLNELLQQHFNGGWGKDEKEKNASNEGYVIRGTDINDIKTSNFSYIPKRYHSEKDIYGKQLNKYDIILELSNGNINNIGRTLLIDDLLLKRLNPVISASFCKVLRFKDSVNAIYVYYFLQYMQNSGLMNFYKNSGANGINNFNFKRFLHMEVLIPNRTDLAEELETIFNSIVLLRESNCNLIQQRDLLLPRLMSGKLEV